MSTLAEERAKADKDALASMRNARDNMSVALNRIEHLERALSNAMGGLRLCKGWTGPATYISGGSSGETVHKRIDYYINEADTALKAGA